MKFENTFFQIAKLRYSGIFNDFQQNSEFSLLEPLVTKCWSDSPCLKGLMNIYGSGQGPSEVVFYTLRIFFC